MRGGHRELQGCPVYLLRRTAATVLFAWRGRVIIWLRRGHEHTTLPCIVTWTPLHLYTNENVLRARKQVPRFQQSCTALGFLQVQYYSSALLVILQAPRRTGPAGPTLDPGIKHWHGSVRSPRAGRQRCRARRRRWGRSCRSGTAPVAPVRGPPPRSRPTGPGPGGSRCT